MLHRYIHLLVVGILKRLLILGSGYHVDGTSTAMGKRLYWETSGFPSLGQHKVAMGHFFQLPHG